jgi:hypothetical protein
MPRTKTASGLAAAMRRKSSARNGRSAAQRSGQPRKPPSWALDSVIIRPCPACEDVRKVQHTSGGTSPPSALMPGMR